MRVNNPLYDPLNICIDIPLCMNDYKREDGLIAQTLKRSCVTKTNPFNRLYERKGPEGFSTGLTRSFQCFLYHGMCSMY